MFEMVITDVPEVKTPARPSIFDNPIILPEEAAKPKLSELLRQARIPQIHGRMFEYIEIFIPDFDTTLWQEMPMPTALRRHREQRIGGACALGAMAIGAGVPDHVFSATGGIQNATGVNLLGYVTSPLSGQMTELGNAIISLNDNAHWSFEKIANWLESIGL